MLADLDLTHDAAAVRRATYEASGFVVRACSTPRASTPGVDAAADRRDRWRHRVDEWVQAVADATGLPVDCVAVPEGGALGSAWLARIAAGLEEPMAMTEGRRWARAGRTVEPEPAWSAAVAERYERFLELTGLGRP